MQYLSAKLIPNYPLVALGARWFLVFLTLVLIRPAWAQQPSPEQISAIRSSCRADYQARCAAVQPGGPEALACLKKNIASLSPGCQKAVASVGGVAPAAPSASSAPTAAAAAAPTPPASGGAANSAAMGGATMGAMPAAPPSRAQLVMLRQACTQDYRTNCAGVPLGGGRAISCLAANQSRLSPGCQRALAMAKGGM
jgi:hypothetical protein